MDGWMDRSTDRQTDKQMIDTLYLLEIHVYIIYIHSYLCASVNFTQLLTGLPPVEPWILPQDVYIAALAPLQLPGDARTLVVQVLTSSGPAPDALVVPLVDESYQATRPKNGSD
jgi:hypothetical protein